MRKVLLLFLFLSSVSYSFCQEYNLLYYSVGFMSDYMGRRIVKGDGINDYSIDDFFHKSRLYDLYRLDTLIKQYNLSHHKKYNYEIKRRVAEVNCQECSNFYAIYSEELSKQINSFYNFKKDKLNSDKIRYYEGKLKLWKIRLACKTKQLSFFAGAFYRYGGKDKFGYYFKFGNSVKKLKIIKELIIKYHCNITQEFDNQVKGLYIAPLIKTIYFEPSDKIKGLIDNELNLKNMLINTPANSKLALCAGFMSSTRKI